jgi:Transcription termination factor nusG
VFWAAAQLKSQKERLALRTLTLAGFATYFPRLRERCARRGLVTDTAPLVFPGYCSVAIELQWVAAHYAPGVIRLVMDGVRPARVPDRIIAELRAESVAG